MASDTNISAINAAIIQQRIQITISATIYVYYFLPNQPVHTSSRTGHRYTQEIRRAHPRRVMEIIRMPITTLLDL